MPSRRPQVPLSRERVVGTAVALADEKGAAGVTMRAVAGLLGVEAMSLYNHVAGREAILDGMVDTVFAEIELPEPTTDWRSAMRDRAGSARAALRRHPWAVGLMDTRGRPGPATLRHHDAVLGALRSNGFSVVKAVHAVSAIDSYVYGFVLQELSLPFTTDTDFEQVAGDILEHLPRDTYPHLAEVIVDAPPYEPDASFAFGLALILDGLKP